MMRNTLTTLFFFLIAACSFAQKNIIGDPGFESPYLTNQLTGTDQWIHVFNSDIVAGEMKRILSYGFPDSMVFCRAAYKTTGLNNRSSCYLTQRMTGLKAKKYRLVFKTWISSRDIYYTAEVNFPNENYTNENGTRAAQVIAQSASSSGMNYHIPGNWKTQVLDFDLSGIKDPERLKIVRFSLYPNCNNGSTISRSCDYMIAEPQLYEVTGTRTDYFTDGEFESWTITGTSPVSNYWQSNPGNGACVKRAPGHADTDYSMSISTPSDNDGTTFETTDGSIFIPQADIDLTFFARSEDAGGQAQITLGGKDLGTITLTPSWQKYSLNVDLSQTANPEQKLRFGLLKAGTYYIDGCHIARTDGLFEPEPLNGIDNKTIFVTTDADSGAGSLRQSVADAAAGDTILIPGNYEITLHSELMIAKSLTIDGQGAVIRVADPGATSQKLLIIGESSSDTEANAADVTLRNLMLEPGDISNTHSTASNIANCGAGITLFNYSKLTAEGVTIDGGKGNYAGAIHVNHNSSTITLLNCRFLNNQASSSNGGAIMLKGTARIDSCLFEGNFAKGNGSALATYGQSDITNSIFRNNESQSNVGGAIVNYSQTNGIVDISNSLFDGNKCSHTGAGGGAIAANHNQSTTHITNCTFIKNTGTSAGAVYFGTNSSVATAGAMTFINNTFAGNEGGSGGAGALYVANTKTISYTFSILLINNIFTYNYTPAGLQDVMLQNTSLYDLQGSNNIFGISTGTESCTGSIPFSYDPATELFASYTGTDRPIPLSDEDGTIHLSGKNSAACAAGFGYGNYEPELIPGLDQTGAKRAIVPCIGASEFIPDTETSAPGVSPASYVLYPNPAEDIIYLKNGQDIHQVVFFDLTGRKVLEDHGKQGRIELRNLAPGIYLGTIYTKYGTVTQRVRVK